jgi:hypothetical protein
MSVHVAAAGQQSAHQRIAQAGRTQTRIAAQIDALAAVPLQVGAEGAAQLFHICVQQFHVGDAANIVFPENGRFEHWFKMKAVIGR